MPIEMWTFHQSNGLVEDFKGFLFGRSYAGHGEGKNNPALQEIHAGRRWNKEKELWELADGLTEDDWGPLPRGIYEMREPVDTETHGPFVIWFFPNPANEMFGRSGFGWHGDSIEHPGLASEGCICSLRIVRETVWRSNDHRVQVVL